MKYLFLVLFLTSCATSETSDTGLTYMVKEVIVDTGCQYRRVEEAEKDLSVRVTKIKCKCEVRRPAFTYLCTPKSNVTEGFAGDKITFYLKTTYDVNFGSTVSLTCPVVCESP